MAQSLEVQIKATSDVPAVVDKTKQAATSFEKQVEGIGAKFKGAFKDIFLSFLGPMALVSAAIGLFTKMIQDAQKKREDANQSAIDGTNNLMSAEDRYWANKTQNEKESKAQVEAAKIQREETTKGFLKSDDPRAKKLLEESGYFSAGARTTKSAIKKASEDPEIQKKVQELLAPEAKGMTTGKDYIAPTGFSNVIGVGANPVLEAMTRQLEEQQLQTALLQQIADKGQPPSADFTKEPASRYPGRGYIPE